MYRARCGRGVPAQQATTNEREIDGEALSQVAGWRRVIPPHHSTLGGILWRKYCLNTSVVPKPLLRPRHLPNRPRKMRLPARLYGRGLRLRRLRLPAQLRGTRLLRRYKMRL